MAQTSPDLASSGTLHEIEPIERETIRRVTWRLMPLLMLGYFCAYLDRSNVGMAATTMVQYLGFTMQCSASAPDCSSWATSWAKYPAT